MHEKVKTVIGAITFNDKHYLEKTLPILSKLPDSQVVLLDNANNDEIRDFIAKEYPEVVFLRHPDGNIGFGKGNNYILEKAPESKYFFCVNTDILIEENTFKKCIEYLDSHDDICIASAKLHYWDFDKDLKTDQIDTLGIIGNRSHHFWDRGQGKKDKGQYDDSISNIFGVSGAAFIVKRKCIEKILGNPHKLFDENIFIYKEDVDLAYRMKWLGMKINFLTDVLGYHDRTLAEGNKKSLFLAKESYKNHLLMLRNNFSSKFSLHTKFLTFVRELSKVFYYLFTKPKVLSELPKAFKIKIQKSKRIVSPKEVEKSLLK
jgi:GT2 family glycosyltransferase